MFDWEYAIALDTVLGNQASSRREGKSHRFSRVATGTWLIFSINGGDVPSKLEFVQ